MSDIDLIPALNAAVLSVSVIDTTAESYAEAVGAARRAVIAAAPFIERAVREQVAQELLAQARPHDARGFSAVGDAYAHAARIARGDS